MPRRFSPGRCCCRDPVICPVCNPANIPQAFRIDFPNAPTDLGCGNCAAWFSSFEADFCGYTDPATLCPTDAFKNCFWIYRGGPCPDPFDPTWLSGIAVTLGQNLTVAADLDITILVASDIQGITKLCPHNCDLLGSNGYQYYYTLPGGYGGNCISLINNLVIPADLFLDTYNSNTPLCQFGPLVPATPGVVNNLRLTAIA